MARLFMTGFELGDTVDSNNIGHPDGQNTSNLFSTTTKRGIGARSADMGTIAVARALQTIRAAAQASGVKTFGRVYVNFTSLPNAATDPELFGFQDGGGSAIAWISFDSTGALKLRGLAGSGAATTFGTSAAGIVAVNTWYRLELMVQQSSVANSGALELRLDGNVVLSLTGLDMWATVGLLRSYIGTNLNAWNALGSQHVFYDDLAVNDDQGADTTQTSFPGPSKGIVLLSPISDGQVGTWTGGLGGITNLFDAVNNAPPGGTAAESNTTQIESADTTPDNATDEYRPNMTTYTTAGADAGDVVKSCVAHVNHGEDVATGTKTGKFRIESNPAQAAYDTFTFGDDVGLLGTYPSNWKWKLGTPVTPASEPVHGTSPQIALRKTDTGNRVASVDAVVMYADIRQAPSLLPDTRRVQRNMLLRR